MKTTRIKPSEVKKDWWLVDASGHTVGRLASKIAHTLRGKHKPTFEPHVDGGDNVVVVNAEKVVLTGRKWEQKNYYRHSGYIGGIKETRADVMRDKHPERILQLAVRGMLPKSKLGKHILKNLKVYAGAEHPHEAQKPQTLTTAPAKRGE